MLRKRSDRLAPPAMFAAMECEHWCTRAAHVGPCKGCNASSQAFAVILLIVCRLLAPGSPAGRVRPSGQYGVFSIAAFRFELHTQWWPLFFRPMGVLNLIYLIRAVGDCVRTVPEGYARSANLGASQCSLVDTGTTAIILLSLATSMASFGFKAAHLELLRNKWAETKLLKVEKEELLAQLYVSLGPEEAQKVEVLLDGQMARRKSLSLSLKLPPLLHPQPSMPRSPRSTTRAVQNKPELAIFFQ